MWIMDLEGDAINTDYIASISIEHMEIDCNDSGSDEGCLEKHYAIIGRLDSEVQPDVAFLERMDMNEAKAEMQKMIGVMNHDRSR